MVRPWPAFPLSCEGCEAFAVGLEAVGLLQKHFPDFYEQNAGCPATPERLLGAIAAFFQLVEERHGLPLRWPADEVGELGHAESPDVTLAMYDFVNPEFMRDLGYYVFTMRPAYYGVGVQTLIDEGYSTSCPLRLALYWLFQGTVLDIGIDVGALIDEAHGLPDSVGETIACLPTLRRDVGCHELVALAAQDIPEASGLADPGSIILYAFGQTGNPLADTNEYEMAEIYGDEDVEWWGWDDLPRLGALSQQAQQIEAAFDAWQRRVVDAGGRGVEEVAELLQRHARTLRRRDRRQAKTSKTLMETLGTTTENHHDDDTPTGAAVAAWATTAAAA